MSYYTEEQLKSMNFAFLGKNVRISDKAVFYDTHLQKIGDHARIDDFAVLSGKIELGRNVFIGLQSNLAGGEPGIRIGDFSTLAYGCQIFAQSDDYSGATLTNPTIPDKYKNEIKKAIIIEKHCILGTNTIVFPGVKISMGCSVGAGSIILKTTEPWGIYLGSPAVRISERKQDLLKLEQDYISEFG